MHSVLIEACVTTHNEARVAWQGGAGRMELCARLDLGGLTPSPTLFSQIAAESPVPIFPMIRIRGGDFVYTTSEIDTMIGEAREFVRLGARGVVFGALDAIGSIDAAAVRAIRAAIGEATLTFHRAFDECREPFESLDTLIELGVDCLLTSGQAPSAWQGRELIAKLVERAAGRIVIMAGAGVRPDNARELIEATDVTELHASLRGDLERIAGISAAVQGG